MSRAEEQAFRSVKITAKSYIWAGPTIFEKWVPLTVITVPRRAYSHFVRPHASLRVSLVQLRERGGKLVAQRYRWRTPAMAAGRTPRRWTGQEVLSYPLLPVPSFIICVCMKREDTREMAVGGLVKMQAGEHVALQDTLAYLNSQMRIEPDRKVFVGAGSIIHYIQ